MKKLAIYVVIVIIGVLLSFPMISGIKLKEAYLQRIGAMPEQPGVTLHKESYDRGWFRSSAVTRIELDLERLLDDPKYAGKPANLIVRSDFSHGPVVLTDMGVRFGLGYGSLNLSGADLLGVEDTLSEWLAAAPVSIHTLINFDQSAHTELTVAAYESDDGDDHMRFGGASASLMSNSNLTRFDGSLVVHATSIITTGFALDMGESSGSLNYQGSNPYSMVGEMVFNIPSLSIASKSGAVVLQGINLNSGNQMNQGKLDYFQTIEVGSIESPLPLTSARWHLEFTGVSPVGLEAWSDFTLEYEERAQAGKLPLDENGEPVLTPEMEAQLEQVMVELLQPGLAFTQRLDVDALGTNHNANMVMTYTGLPDGVSVDQVDDPMFYLQAIQGSLTVELDEESVMNSPLVDTVMPLLQQGLLMSEGGKLLLHAKLEEGAMMLNGHPIPLEALLMSAMEASAGSETDEEQAEPEAATE